LKPINSSVELTFLMIILVFGFAGLVGTTCFVTIVFPSDVMTTVFFSSTCDGFASIFLVATLVVVLVGVATVAGLFSTFLTAAWEASGFLVVDTATKGLALSVSFDFITGLGSIIGFLSG